MHDGTSDGLTTPATPGLTPPTVRGAVPITRPAWPTVIGAIAMVLAILGILGSLWGLAAPWVLASVMQDVPGWEQQSGLMMVLFNLVGLGVNVLLLVGAVMLLRWHRRACTVLRVYAVAAIVIGVLSSIWGVSAMLDQVDGLQQQAGAPPPAMVVGMGVIGGCMAIVFALAFPVFLLVWLSRASVKRDVERWFNGGAGVIA